MSRKKSRFMIDGQFIIVDGVPITGGLMRENTPSNYYKTVTKEIKKIINLSDKVKTIIFKDARDTTNSIYFTVVLTNGIKFEASVRTHKYRKENMTYRYNRNKEDEVKKTYFIHRHSSFDLLREHILSDVDYFYSYDEDFDITYNYVHWDKDLVEKADTESLDKLQNFPNGKAHCFNCGMIVRWW